MAGATLSPTYATDLDFGTMKDIQITFHGNDGTRFEPQQRQLNCPHCDFAAGCPAEMTQHRWEVHPMLTRQKRHKTTSPKGARKRPNSESSDEEKYTSSVDSAPKKKHSPAHLLMTSCNDNDCSHVRRASSADAIRRLKEAEEQTKLKSHSLDDLHSSNLYVTSHKRQRSEGKWESDDVIVRCDEPTNDDLVTSSRPDVEDLHTLARAATSAEPLPRKNEAVPIPPNWWPYLGGIVPNFTCVPGTLPHVFGQNLAEGHPMQIPSNIFTSQPSFTMFGSYPPTPGFPVNFPIYLPPSINTTPPQPDKLSTLSDVASRYLAGADEKEEAGPPRGSTALQADSRLNAPRHNEQVAPREVSRSPAFVSQPVAPKKSSPIPTPQPPTQKKIVMDDDRVRSLEEALSKIDCCDPHERSNVLPYQCSDGKWRMVESKCVGGAWVVHVPGAVQPSIYLPLQKSAPKGTLDNWLKEQLTSTRKPRSHSLSTPSRNTVGSQPQQRHFANVQKYNPLATSGRIAIPRHSGMPVSSGDAIKNLLLKKTAVA